MMKKMYVATTRCAAAVVSAVVGWCSDERIRAPVLHDASQIDYCRYWVAPHYHQLLVLEIVYEAAAGNTRIFFKDGKKHTGID